MKVAFRQKVTFTVGTSITTGRDNQVVWNGIHHKTRPGGGATSHGYPDDTYFDRVKLELEQKGIRPPPAPSAASAASTARRAKRAKGAGNGKQ